MIGIFLFITTSSSQSFGTINYKLFHYYYLLFLKKYSDYWFTFHIYIYIVFKTYLLVSCSTRSSKVFACYTSYVYHLRYLSWNVHNLFINFLLPNHGKETTHCFQLILSLILFFLFPSILRLSLSPRTMPCGRCC